jgi:hypothetical protein
LRFEIYEVQNPEEILTIDRGEGLKIVEMG